MAATGVELRIRDLVERHRRPVGLAAAAGCLVLAAVWLVVVPEKAVVSTGVQELALRYGHSACWAFLAGAATLYAFRAPRRATATVAGLAFAAYAVFFAATVL